MQYKYKVLPFLDEYVAVGICENAKDAEYNIIRLNEIGKSIFEMFIDGKSEQQIVSALLEEYNATEQQLDGLVRNFTKDLAQKVNMPPTEIPSLLVGNATGKPQNQTIPEGVTYDAKRVKLFRILFEALQEENFPSIPEQYQTDAAYDNFAFFESYFSNYNLGKALDIEVAREIARTGNSDAIPKENLHDILGTYRIVSDRQEMSRTPKSYEEFIEILQDRHRILMATRPDRKPGEFKDVNNHAGSTQFVDYTLVKGTFQKAFDYYMALESPFAKALYMMFMITEIHPFKDGNGRISRIMMNAELVAAGQSQILIPAVFRQFYGYAQRRLSNEGNPSDLIQEMQRVRRFSTKIPIDDFDAAREYLERCNAFKTYPQFIGRSSQQMII